MNADVHQIISRVASCFGVQEADILRSRDRHEPLATARKVAMALVNDHLRNMNATAQLFDRCPTNILYAVNRADQSLIDKCRNNQPIDLRLVRDRVYEKRTKRKRQCFCGNPAIRRDSSGWVCQRCADIEGRIFWDYIQ